MATLKTQAASTVSDTITDKRESTGGRRPTGVSIEKTEAKSEPMLPKSSNMFK